VLNRVPFMALEMKYWTGEYAEHHLDNLKMPHGIVALRTSFSDAEARVGLSKIAQAYRAARPSRQQGRYGVGPQLAAVGFELRARTEARDISAFTKALKLF
jgi:hypothetical protein